MREISIWWPSVEHFSFLASLLQEVDVSKAFIFNGHQGGSSCFKTSLLIGRSCQIRLMGVHYLSMICGANQRQDKYHSSRRWMANSSLLDSVGLPKVSQMPEWPYMRSASSQMAKCPPPPMARLSGELN